MSVCYSYHNVSKYISLWVKSLKEIKDWRSETWWCYSLEVWMTFSIVSMRVKGKGEEKHPLSCVGCKVTGRFSSWDMAASPGADLFDTKKSLWGHNIWHVCGWVGVPMFALPYYRFTVTQFIKGQKLPDKEHLVCGTWTGKLASCPCSLLQGPMRQHLPLSPPALPLFFLWRGPPRLVAAHTEGPQSPGGPLQATPPPPGPP